MNRYHIRFNVRHGEHGSIDEVWRVFENGHEYLAKKLQINVPVFDETTIENGIERWNVCCVGNMVIDADGTAIIS